MTAARRPPPRPRAICPEACQPPGPSVALNGRRAWMLGVFGLAMAARPGAVRAQSGAVATPGGAPSPATGPGSVPPAASAGPASAAAPAPPPVHPPAAARPPGIQSLDLQRGEEGLSLSFVLGFDLPRAVEDALLKGVPLHFTAQAMLMRERWYWTDRRINTAARSWRLTYQPLTRRFRVSQGGLAQNFDDLDSALAACGRASGWKVAEPTQLDDGSRQYVEFSYRLDTSLLPRPMQIGIGGQPDWNLVFERSVRVD